MLFWIRLLLSGTWLLIVCSVGLLLCVFRWKDPWVMQTTARAYGRVALRILGLKLQVQGLEHLNAPGPFVVVANHQSNWDSVLLGAIYPERTFIIGKKELIWLPVFGFLFVGSGNVLVDRKNRVRAAQSLERAAKKIRDHRQSVLIFPEGTRNRSGEPLLPFKKGAFRLALETGAPLLILVAPPLKAWFSWKEKRIRPGILPLEVLPPFSTRGYSLGEEERLLDEVRVKMLEAYERLAKSSGIR